MNSLITVTKPQYDVAILGGGINGCAVAAEAQSRGLSVLLIEKNDLASGTSSASSQLIHGGLRYLEQGAFHLVTESLREQAILLQRAPHLVRPLRFILPHSKGMRAAWLMRCGLWCYDHLANRSILPRSRGIRFQADNPLLLSYQRGFVYADCVSDDARLVISNALFAAERGATILTHTEVMSAERGATQWTLTCRSADQVLQKIHCRVFINATGAWLAHSHQQLLGEALPARMILSQGSHFLIKRRYSDEFAYLLQNKDGRVVFVTPWHGFTLVGTTDTPFTGDPAQCAMTASEETYLCETVNDYFKIPIRPEEILWRYSGVRALFNQSGRTDLAKVSREGHFSIAAGASAAPLVLLFGGKVTTHRHFAEKIIDSLNSFFPGLAKSQTASLPLPGGDLAEHDLNSVITQYQCTYPWLPKPLLDRYLNAYGTRISQLLQGCHQLSDMGKDLGLGLYQREIDFLSQHEWATSLDDILWRRSKLGLDFLAAGRAPGD